MKPISILSYLFCLFISPINTALSANNEHYCNERFGFCLDYPQDMESSISPTGDAVVISNDKGDDNSFSVMAHGMINTSETGKPQTISAVTKENSQDFEKITYRKKQSSKIILSGYRDNKKTIVYKKIYVGKHYINRLIFSYPATDKELYDDTVKKIIKSFKLGSLNKAKKHSGTAKLSSAYQPYCNKRFGFCFDHPKGMKPNISDSGDGITLTQNKKGETEDYISFSIIAYGNVNPTAENKPLNIDKVMQEEKNHFEKLTYHKKKGNGITLSGYTDNKESITYKKIYVGDDYKNTLVLTYPTVDKKRYDKAVTKIAASFTAGDLVSQ